MNYPKRRKSKDNPYTLIYDSANNTYAISFMDSKKRLICIKINYDLYKTFNDFELDDISQLNKYDRHIEHLNIMESDELLYKRMLYQSKTTDEIVENKIRNNNLKQAIKSLPEIQRRRLKKYYFEDKTLDEIAKEEGCTKSAVKFSIDIAIEKISKKFKN